MANAAHYYERNLLPSLAIAKEVLAIHHMVTCAFTFARVVVAKQIAAHGDLADRCFQVTNLFLQQIWEVHKAIISQRSGGLDDRSIEHLQHFFEEVHVSDVYFDNPQEVDDAQKGAAIKAVAASLQRIYCIHIRHFVKQEVPPTLQHISCFDYAIHLAGFDRGEFRAALLAKRPAKRAEGRDITFDDYIEYLEQHGMSRVALPLQPGDIIVYSDEHHVIQHAAFVADPPTHVCAKMGNDNSDAYLHPVDATAIQYGGFFQILRKDQP